MEIQSKNQLTDAKAVVPADDQDLTYWSREFGIAKEELLAFVKRGSTVSAAVENYVKSTRLAV